MKREKLKLSPNTVEIEPGPYLQIIYNRKDKARKTE